MAKGNKKDFFALVGQAVNAPDSETDNLKKNLLLPPTEMDIQKHERMKLHLPEQKPNGLSLLLDESTPSAPTPQPNSKKGVEKKLSHSFDGSISVGDLSITSATLSEVPQKTLEINSAMCNVRIHPQQDFKLNMLAQKLRYEHNLSAKSGINKTTLIYLMLENALKEVEV